MKHVSKRIKAYTNFRYIVIVITAFYCCLFVCHLFDACFKSTHILGAKKHVFKAKWMNEWQKKNKRHHANNTFKNKQTRGKGTQTPKCKPLFVGQLRVCYNICLLLHGRTVNDYVWFMIIQWSCSVNFFFSFSIYSAICPFLLFC